MYERRPNPTIMAPHQHNPTWLPSSSSDSSITRRRRASDILMQLVQRLGQETKKNSHGHDSALPIELYYYCCLHEAVRRGANQNSNLHYELFFCYAGMVPHVPYVSVRTHTVHKRVSTQGLSIQHTNRRQAQGTWGCIVVVLTEVDA